MASTSSDGVKVKVCKKCKRNLLNGCKCINCYNYYHLSCARNCNAVKFIDSDTVTCCNEIPNNDDEDETDTAFLDALENINTDKKVNIEIFNYIIKQKNTIINQLKERIKLLNTQIEIINRNTDKDEANAKNIRTDKIESHVRTERKTQSSGTANVATSYKTPERNEITKQQVENAIQEANMLQKCTEYIHIGEDTNLITRSQPQMDDGWQKVRSKKRRRSLVIGMNQDTQVNGREIKHVPKFSNLHVYRVDPEMTEEELITLIKPHFPEVQCSKLDSKHPKIYSSFKVTIFSKHFESAMNPSKWPMGAHVQPFLQLRMKKESNHQKPPDKQQQPKRTK